MKQSVYTARLNQTPHEKDFLATLMVMPWELKKVTDELMIDQECFNNIQNRDVFLGLVNYVASYGDGDDDIYMVDIPTLRECIKAGNPNSFADEIYLKELLARGANTRDVAGDPIRFYAEKLKLHNQKISIAQMADTLGEISADPQINKNTELYAQARATFDKHILSLETPDTLFCTDVSSRVREMLTRMREGEDVHLQPVGFKGIDRHIGGGLSTGSMTIIAARPGCGKTTLMLNMASNLIEDQSTENRPVVFFSLEMTTERLLQKFLTAFTESTLYELRNYPSDAQINRLENHLRKAFYRDGKPVNSLLIADKGSIRLTQMRQQLKKVCDERGGITAVFIDYLQLMKLPGRNDNRNLELSEISRALCEMSKEFDTRFIVASQLNRQIEANNKSMNGTETPKNSYLRDSGAIEQDADLIMFLTPDGTSNDGNKLVKAHITKNRYGSLTDDKPIELQFNGAISLFSEPVKHALSGYYNRKGPSEYQGN